MYVKSETPVLSNSDRIDQLAKLMEEHKLPPHPVENVFTPGLYTRITRVPKGVLFVSERHKTEHPFVMTKGVIVVFDEETGKKTKLIAPCYGVTKPNTRRTVTVLEDVEWMTFHVTDLTDVEKIGDEILYQNNLPSQYKEIANMERIEQCRG